MIVVPAACWGKYRQSRRRLPFPPARWCKDYASAALFFFAEEKPAAALPLLKVAAYSIISLRQRIYFLDIFSPARRGVDIIIIERHADAPGTVASTRYFAFAGRRRLFYHYYLHRTLALPISRASLAF